MGGILIRLLEELKYLAMEVLVGLTPLNLVVVTESKVASLRLGSFGALKGYLLTAT